jgi:acyl-CoA reductase-like NAD-dependent aldehyde dehydrogenase
VLAVADLPAGVVNLISGVHAELIDPLVAHHDLDGVLDAKGDPSLSGQVARTGAETIKRVARLDTRAPASLAAITPFVEIKSVWHPIGT